MKPALSNAPADLLTRYPREAGANLLNLFHKIRFRFHLNCPAAAEGTGNLRPQKQISNRCRLFLPSGAQSKSRHKKLPPDAKKAGISAMMYPTPPPFSSHLLRNKDITSEKAHLTLQNKGLTHFMFAAVYGKKGFTWSALSTQPCCSNRSMHQTRPKPHRQAVV
jgi:hypothetical protein